MKEEFRGEEYSGGTISTLSDNQYDTTNGQILILPSYALVRRLDPETCCYPDYTPENLIATGVDFLRLDGYDCFDLALTFNLTRLRLYPTPSSSSRMRLLNTLKRNWAKLQKRIGNNSRINHLHFNPDVLDPISLCGTIFQVSYKKHSRCKSPGGSERKSCLKSGSLTISDEWLACLKHSHNSSETKQRLAEVLTHPVNITTRTRNERISSESSIGDALEQNGECSVVSLRNTQNGLEEDTSLPTASMKICFEFPGILKRDVFSTVGFKTFVQGKFAEQPLVRDELLKIDTVKNKSVYIIPPVESDTEKMVKVLSPIHDIVVKPTAFSDPWQLEPTKRSSSPKSLDTRTVAGFSEVFDGEIESEKASLFNSFAELNRNIMHLGHAICSTVAVVAQLGNPML